MVRSLDKLTIKGFKSIQALEDFELGKINILIGANGAGKSNFVSFFSLLKAMMRLPLPVLSYSSFNDYIREGGGSDDFLFNGAKTTPQIDIQMDFGDNSYRFTLIPTVDELFILNQEKMYFGRTNDNKTNVGNQYTELIKIIVREKGKSYFIKAT